MHYLNAEPGEIVNRRIKRTSTEKLVESGEPPQCFAAPVAPYWREELCRERRYGRSHSHAPACPPSPSRRCNANWAHATALRGGRLAV